MCDTSKEQLEREVKSVAEMVEKLTDGWRFCNTCGLYVKDDEHCGESTIDLYDYIYNSLNKKLTTELNGNLLGVCMTVAWGGPNIYIDTNTEYVEGYWGCDEYKVRLSNNALCGIDEQVNEMRY